MNKVLKMGIAGFNDRWQVSVKKAGEGATVKFPGQKAMIKTKDGWRKLTLLRRIINAFS